MSLPAGFQGIGLVFNRTSDWSFKGTGRISGRPVGFSLDVVVWREDLSRELHRVGYGLSKGLDRVRS